MHALQDESAAGEAALRVLLVCHCCAPDGGSEARMSWRWIESLAEAGVTLTVLHNGADPTSASGVGSPPPGVELVDVRAPRVSRRLPVPLYTAIDYWLWQRAALRRARTLHELEPFDVVHHLSWGSLNYGSLFASLDVPFVMGPIGGGTRTPAAFRDLLPYSWGYERTRNRLVDSVLVNPFARFTMRRAELVFASNRETKTLIDRFGVKQCSVLLDDGVADEELSTIPVDQTSDGPLRVLWISRMMEFKGLEMSLDAVELAAKETDVKMTVLGDGPDRSRNADRLADLVERGIVDDLGWADQQTIDDCFRTHHVLLYNSLRDNGSAPLHEATRWGLPAVVIDHQGPRQITNDRWATKVPPIDPQRTTHDLADALVALALDPARRTEMGWAALEAGAANTWSARAATVVGAYRSIVRT